MSNSNPQPTTSINEILEGALMDLFNALAEAGCTLEHIKLGEPLYINGNEVKSLHGVEIKSIIYEDEATHWRHG